MDVKNVLAAKISITKRNYLKGELNDRHPGAFKQTGWQECAEMNLNIK